MVQASSNTLATLDAPAVDPPAVGLLASLSGDYNLVEETEAALNVNGVPQRWELGYRYLPEQMCQRGRMVDPCADSSMDIPFNPGVVEAMAGQVWAGDHCSAFGWKGHNYQERAQRALLACESAQIARELWAGDLAQAAGWPNEYLASPAAEVLTAGPVSAGLALTILEEGIARTSNGQPGMIHCTRAVGSALSELGNTFRSVNGLIVTYMGTIISPDAGNPGTGLNGLNSGTSQWAYATLLPTVRRGAIVLEPETFEEAVDRSVNTIEWRAWRAAAASFPPCTLVAAEVNLPLPVIGS